MSAQPQINAPSEGPSLDSEVRIFSVLSQFAAMQVVLAATGIVRNKVIAYRLGPGAFGELAQIGTVTSTIGTLVCFGLGIGLSRNAAKADTLEGRQAQLATANGLVLTLAAVACSLSGLLLFSGHLLPMAGLTESVAAVTATAIFIAALPIEALKNNYLAFLQGILDVKGLAVRRSVAVMLATAVAIPLIWVFGFVGAAIQYVLLSAFAAVLLGWRCRNLGCPPLSVKFDRGIMLHLVSFGVASLASGFAQSFGDTAVRTSLIHAVGATANGLLQAPYVLAQTVKAIVLASIGSISLATIAGQKDPKSISAAVDRLLNVVVPVGASALGILGLLGSHALALLYSSSFSAGATLFPWLLSADLLMVFVWVVGAPLLAFGDRALWLALELLFTAARWGIAVLLLGGLGTVAVVLGYLAAAVLHTFLNLVVFRLRYGLHIAGGHVFRLLLGIAVVVSLSLVGSRARAPWLLTAGGLAWLVYTVAYAQRTHLFSELQQRFIAMRIQKG